MDGETNKSKKLEKIYVAGAVILVLIFIISFYWGKIQKYYKDSRRDDFISVSQNYIVEDNKNFYINSILLSDIMGIYRINKTTMENELLLPSASNHLVLEGNYLYYLNGESIYRMELKSKKNEKLIDFAYFKFYLYEDNIIYIDNLRRLMKYNIKTKTSKELIAAPDGFLVVDDKAYLIYNGGTNILELDLKNNNSKTYTTDNQVYDLGYYKGYFYFRNQMGQLEKYDSTFNKVNELKTNAEVMNFSIANDKIYTLEINNTGLCNLYSYDLDGKNKTLIKENVYQNIFANYVVEINMLNKSTLYDFIKNKNIEYKELVPTVYNKVEQNTVSKNEGYRIVKLDNKYYYFNLNEIYEYDLNTNQSKAMGIKGVEKIGEVAGNVAYIKNNLLYVFDKEEKLISNLCVLDFCNYKDYVYIRTNRGLLYKINIKTSEIDKIDEFVTGEILKDNNKIYYIKKDIITSTTNDITMCEYDLENSVLYKHLISGLPNEYDIKVYKGNIYYNDSDGYYRYNLVTKQKQKILNKTDIYVSYFNDNKMYYNSEGNLYEIDLNTLKSKQLVHIGSSEGILVDKEIGKVVVKPFGVNDIAFK